MFLVSKVPHPLFLGIMIATAMTACSSGSEETKGVDDGDSTVVAWDDIKQPQGQTPTAAPGAIASQAAETFSIIQPAAVVNTAIFMAEWTEPAKVKDYDVMLSLSDRCTVLPIVAVPDYTSTSFDFGPLAEGTYYLCVQAILKGSGAQWAENSPFAVTVDLTPPEAFTLDAVDTPSSASMPIITWQPAAGADSYSLTIARDQACEEVEQFYPNLTVTSQSLDLLANGRYFICAFAHDLAQNKTSASNSGMEFTISSGPSAITSVTSSSTDGFYKEGTVVTLNVNFDQVVTLDAGADVPKLKLETGEQDGYATYSAGSGTSSLVFTYTVASGETSADLEVHGAKPQIIYGDRILRSSAGISIISQGNEINEPWLSQSHNLVIDTTAPGAFTITGPSSPSALAGPSVTWTNNGNSASWRLIIDDEATCSQPYLQLHPNLTDTSKTLTALADGSYYACVSAFDEAGHTTVAANNAFAFTVAIP